jgi:hypothetical protein
MSYIVLICACLHLLLTSGEVITYVNQRIDPLKPEYLKIAKYAKHDVPNWKPGNGKSFIDLSELSATAVCDQSGGGSNQQCSPSSFQLLMFEEPTEKYWMDYWSNRQFCCTAEALDNEVCHGEQLNTLIVPTDLPGAFEQSFILQSDETIKFSHDPTINHHEIKDSSMYVIMMASCDATSQPIFLNGQIDSLDPYGYLPADLFGNLPFYMVLAGLYSLLSIYWMVMNVLYYDQIIPLQFWITCVLGMGMIETTAMYAHYEHWNEVGTYSINLMLTGLVFGVAKRTMSRIVVLLLSLGYGVVKPSIGDDMPKVVQLGCAYFVVSVIYVFIVMFPSKHKSASDEEMDYVSLIVFLLAIIDTIFYIWIIQSINSLLTSLAARQQGEKYLLYRNFRTILFLALFFAVIWGLYSTLVIFDDGQDTDNNNLWQRTWTIDALWELTYLFVLAFIAHMWAPSANSQRYAYSAQLSQLDDDEEYMSGKDMEIEMAGIMDAEYGGALNDEDDPFKAKGANDVAAAISKKE